MEVGQGPNWGCSAKEKKITSVLYLSGQKQTKEYKLQITSFIEARVGYLGHNVSDLYTGGIRFEEQSIKNDTFAI
jgi:hypothetical protein